MDSASSCDPAPGKRRRLAEPPVCEITKRLGATEKHLQGVLDRARENLERLNSVKAEIAEICGNIADAYTKTKQGTNFNAAVDKTVSAVAELLDMPGPQGPSKVQNFSMLSTCKSENFRKMRTLALKVVALELYRTHGTVNYTLDKQSPVITLPLPGGSGTIVIDGGFYGARAMRMCAGDCNYIRVRVVPATATSAAAAQR
jgi:hypothetical protein